VGLEMMTGVFIFPLHAVIVGELPVVDDGDIGERVGPEGVGMADVYDALGGHPDVADSMGSHDSADRVCPVHLGGGTHVLDRLG